MTAKTNYWNQNKVKGGLRILAQSYMKDNSNIKVVVLSSCSTTSCSTTSCSTTSCSTTSCSTTSCSNV